MSQGANQGGASRRDFLKITLASTVAYASGCTLFGTSGGARRIPIGLQLYSVRHECEKDLPAVLEAVAEMGYEGVEFAGYYDRSAEELKALLDANELLCCGTHTSIDSLLGDDLAATIEFQKTIGNRYLIVPGLPEKYRSSADAWRETAKLFNELSDKVREHDMMVGYHNHAVEFQSIDGEVPWDVFATNTKPEVILQLDTGNACHGGADPLATIRKYPTRYTTVHIKEFSEENPKALVGEGDVPWPEVFLALESSGATAWYIVEYESDAYPPLESVKRCLANLRKIGK